MTYRTYLVTGVYFVEEGGRVKATENPTGLGVYVLTCGANLFEHVETMRLSLRHEIIRNPIDPTSNCTWPPAVHHVASIVCMRVSNHQTNPAMLSHRPSSALMICPADDPEVVDDF